MPCDNLSLRAVTARFICMQVLSVNVGQPSVLKFNGQEQTSGFIKKPVSGPVAIRTAGVYGDVRVDPVHGKPDSAVYALSVEMYASFFDKIPFSNIENGMFGENLTMNKLDESQICVGDVFSVGTTLLQATMPRIPCLSLNFRFNHKSALKVFADVRRPGVYFRVLQEGHIAANDAISFKESAETLRVSVMDLWNFVMDKKMDVETAKNWLTIKTHHPQIIKKLKLFLENN